ncbi:hypothetical protein GCM10011375_03270 [Hymenobacter qilianensis]|uniref:Uncharacterized protein n=2 Tax=Hymenobacter qilianensis TaxID=1385715 RepID=A0ACB5PLR0_9BACT|nr:hypothetical protein [Hymenobacter qilianensis]QNP50741.1 hypothetical protein H9L05_11100 [Hymenobacter qilianensis]GGF51080.1 hypothetical protein GCM10011375_03270 [Hymenobacter qilianensis]
MIAWILSVIASLSLLHYQPQTAPAGNQEKVSAAASENPFFARDDIVELTLALPLQNILKDRGPTPGFHPALLTYRDTAAALKTTAVQVKVRGNRRKDPTVCGFPPLLVSFPPDILGSPFGQVKELKLITHCLSDTYTLREYLVYKVYNLLTDKSFRVRLCRITYKDNARKGRADVHYAFFLEEAKAMAARNDATLVPKQFFIGMEHMNQKDMATLALFQYMIGNTDWSVPYRHNIRMLSINQQVKPVAVAYDFDYSGIVMAPYAVPPEQLGITSVRQRLFRGYDFPPETYAEAIKLFNSRRPAIYNVYLSCPYLDQEEKLFATRYLDDFYKTLNNAKDFERSIVRAGIRNGQRYTNVKGLE